jgi:hypothetical protein
MFESVVVLSARRRGLVSGTGVSVPVAQVWMAAVRVRALP